MLEDAEFDNILAGVDSQTELLNLEHLSTPHARKPLSRFSGSAEANFILYKHATVLLN